LAPRRCESTEVQYHRSDSRFNNIRRHRHYSSAATAPRCPAASPASRSLPDRHRRRRSLVQPPHRIPGQ
jgi:hypothetical protein